MHIIKILNKGCERERWRADVNEWVGKSVEKSIHKNSDINAPTVICTRSTKLLSQRTSPHHVYPDITRQILYFSTESVMHTTHTDTWGRLQKSRKIIVIYANIIHAMHRIQIKWRGWFNGYHAAALWIFVCCLAHYYRHSRGCLPLQWKCTIFYFT